MVENFISESSVLDKKGKEWIEKMNRALKNEYEKMIENGYNNLFYVNSKNATGNDHEATVDGVHFTDLGFLRYADFLIDRFDEFKLINKN